MREVRLSMFPDRPLLVDESEYANLKALGIVVELEKTEEVSPVIEEKKTAAKPPTKKEA